LQPIALPSLNLKLATDLRAIHAIGKSQLKSISKSLEREGLKPTTHGNTGKTYCMELCYTIFHSCKFDSENVFASQIHKDLIHCISTPMLDATTHGNTGKTPKHALSMTDIQRVKHVLKEYAVKVGVTNIVALFSLFLCLCVFLHQHLCYCFCEQIIELYAVKFGVPLPGRLPNHRNLKVTLLPSDQTKADIHINTCAIVSVSK
jgi:hypothetical protein